MVGFLRTLDPPLCPHQHNRKFSLALVCRVGRVMKPKKSLGILALCFFVDLIYIKTGKNKILKNFKFFIVQKLHFSRAKNTKDFQNV